MTATADPGQPGQAEASAPGSRLVTLVFTDLVGSTELKQRHGDAAWAAGVSWPFFWRHGQWNELRARIVGNPPHITTWINGVKFMDWTDTQKRLPDTGGIALQVHGGGDLTKQFVRYRNIRVKKLAPGSQP